MAYVRDATAADAPGIAAVWRAGVFAAYPGIIAADIIERCPRRRGSGDADPGDFGGLDARGPRGSYGQGSYTLSVD